MTLREIDQAIQDLFDPETGDLLDDDGIQFEMLQMAREEKIKNTALYFRQLTAESKILSEEISTLRKKRKVTENKLSWIKFLLDQALQGQKFNHPLVSVGYRKSTYLDIQDKEAVIDYCIRAGHSDCLYSPGVEISSKDITRLIKDGEEIPGAVLAERYNLGVK